MEAEGFKEGNWYFFESDVLVRFLYVVKEKQEGIVFLNFRLSKNISHQNPKTDKMENELAINKHDVDKKNIKPKSPQYFKNCEPITSEQRKRFIGIIFTSRLEEDNAGFVS